MEIDEQLSKWRHRCTTFQVHVVYGQQLKLTGGSLPYIQTPDGDFMPLMHAPSSLSTDLLEDGVLIDDTLAPLADDEDGNFS